MFAVASALFAAACVALTVLGICRDPRWLGNAVLLPVTLWTVMAAALALRAHGPLEAMLFVALVSTPATIQGLIVLLIWNGVEVIKREGFSLAHSLSLLLAVGLIVLVVLETVALFADSIIWLDIAIFAVLLAGWFAALLLGYVLYSFVSRSSSAADGQISL